MNLKDIKETAQTALDIANELKNLELKSAILGLKEEMLELREENLSLKEKLSTQTKYNMVFEDNVYWNEKEDGTKEGPYCSACWDSKNNVVRMIVGDFTYKCPVCKISIHK